ncbi:MAG: collagen binding domain-containing protein, partial [Proteocatella sp.]
AMFSFDQNTNTLSINPGNISSEINYITFETELVNQEHYASNYIPDQNSYWNYINRVTMENKQGITVLPKTSATGYAHVESSILEKEGVSYDYSSKELTWKITVNKNEMDIPNAVLQDILPEGQKYVDNSITVLDKNNSNINYAGLFDFSKTENSGKEVLNFNFKNTLDAQYSITFNTKLDENYAASLFSTSGKKEIENTATLLGDSVYLGKLSVTAKKEIANETISKFGAQKSDGLGITADKPVVWEIVVNPNMINIENGVITDKLSSNLELNSSSIKLYEMNILPDGTKTVGNLISFLPSDINYDYTQNQLQFKLPTPSNKCYKLIFETSVKELTSTNVSNEASFSGTGLTKTESSKIDNVYVQITSSGGSATKLLGIIKIYKLDSTDPNNKVPLAGAEFELLDSLGIVRGKQITDNNGNAEFKNLRLNEKYSVRESAAPTGYIKSDKTESITLTSAEKEKLLTFYNERIKPKTPDKPSTPDGGGSTPDKPSTPDGGGSTPDKPSTPDGGGSTPDKPSTPDGGGSTPDKPSTPDGGGSTPDKPSTPTFDVDNMPTPLAGDTAKNESPTESEHQLNTATNLDSKDPNANPKTGDMGLEGLLIAVIAMYVAFNLRYRFKSE